MPMVQYVSGFSVYYNTSPVGAIYHVNTVMYVNSCAFIRTFEPHTNIYPFGPSDNVPCTVAPLVPTILLFSFRYMSLRGRQRFGTLLKGIQCITLWLRVDNPNHNNTTPSPVPSCRIWAAKVILSSPVSPHALLLWVDVVPGRGKPLATTPVIIPVLGATSAFPAAPVPFPDRLQTVDSVQIVPFVQGGRCASSSAFIFYLSFQSSLRLSSLSLERS